MIELDCSEPCQCAQGACQRFRYTVVAEKEKACEWTVSESAVKELGEMGSGGWEGKDPLEDRGCNDLHDWLDFENGFIHRWVLGSGFENRGRANTGPVFGLSHSPPRPGTLTLDWACS